MSIVSRLKQLLTPSAADGRPRRLPSPDALALLCRPEGEPEAELFRGILEEAGIRTLLKNRDALSAQSGAMGPTWAYELWVLRKDLRRARELLSLTDSPEN